MIAAGIVVTSSWGAHAPAVRALAIVIVAGGLAWVSERGRVLVPVSAAVTGHVATFLVAPSGVAVAAAFGATWPLCLLVGGTLLAAATEIQARRWSGPALHAGQVVGVALAATGLAAVTGTTAGIISGFVAVTWVTVGAHRRAAALAVTAVASPVLWALADAGIGAGTFDRAGLIGEPLGWSGPVVGVLAAFVLAITARRTSSNVLMLGGGLSMVSGAVTGLAAVDGPAVLWWSLPALLVIAFESTWWMVPIDGNREAARELIDVPAVPLAVLACGSPILAWFADLTGTVAIALVPATVTAVALALVWFRWHGEGRPVADLAGSAGAAVVLTAAIALDAHPVATAAIAVGLPAGSWLLSLGRAPLALYVPGFWAIVTIVSAGDADEAWGRPVLLALLATLSVVAIGARSHRAAARREVGWFELGALVLAIAATSTALIDVTSEVVLLGAASLLIVLAVGFDRRLGTWACAVGGIVATLSTLAAVESNVIEPSLWIGWTLLAASLVAVGAIARSVEALHAAAVAVVGAATAAAVAAPVEPEQLIISAIIASVTLTGLATAIARRSPLDTAAIAATVVAVGTTSFDVDPLWGSAVWFLVGVQIVVAGMALRRSIVQFGGSMLAAGAAISTWFTSGANAWFVELIAPADITMGDVWMLAATLATFIAGIVARRTLGVSTWLAYSAGFLLLGGWLVAVQIERDTVWALPLALTIGMGSAALGAWRRLAAVLVGGVVLVAVTLGAAIGDGLTDVPTWVWLAAGGLGLLGTAVVIERMGRSGAAGLREMARRWQ